MVNFFYVLLGYAALYESAPMGFPQDITSEILSGGSNLANLGRNDIYNIPSIQNITNMASQLPGMSNGFNIPSPFGIADSGINIPAQVSGILPKLSKLMNPSSKSKNKKDSNTTESAPNGHMTECPRDIFRRGTGTGYMNFLSFLDSAQTVFALDEHNLANPFGSLFDHDILGLTGGHNINQRFLQDDYKNSFFNSRKTVILNGNEPVIEQRQFDTDNHLNRFNMTGNQMDHFNAGNQVDAFSPGSQMGSFHVADMLAQMQQHDSFMSIFPEMATVPHIGCEVDAGLLVKTLPKKTIDFFSPFFMFSAIKKLKTKKKAIILNPFALGGKLVKFFVLMGIIPLTIFKLKGKALFMKLKSVTKAFLLLKKAKKKLTGIKAILFAKKAAIAFKAVVLKLLLWKAIFTTLSAIGVLKLIKVKKIVKLKLLLFFKMGFKSLFSGKGWLKCIWLHAKKACGTNHFGVTPGFFNRIAHDEFEPISDDPTRIEVKDARSLFTLIMKRIGGGVFQFEEQQAVLKDEHDSWLEETAIEAPELLDTSVSETFDNNPLFTQKLSKVFENDDAKAFDIIQQKLAQYDQNLQTKEKTTYLVADDMEFDQEWGGWSDKQFFDAIKDEKIGIDTIDTDHTDYLDHSQLGQDYFEFSKDKTTDFGSDEDINMGTDIWASQNMDFGDKLETDLDDISVMNISDTDMDDSIEFPDVDMTELFLQKMGTMIDVDHEVAANVRSLVSTNGKMVDQLIHEQIRSYEKQITQLEANANQSKFFNTTDNDGISSKAIKTFLGELHL